MRTAAWRHCAVLSVMAAASLSCVQDAAASAEPRFRRIGVEQGLPSGWVTEMTEDRDGYLWMATRDGLARYDGLGFRHFQNDPNDPSSIPCADVQTVLPTRSGRLFVGCSDTGFAELLDADAGRFDRFESAALAIGLQNWSVFSIDEGADGHLWLGTYQEGLIRFDPQTRVFTRLGQLQDIPKELDRALVIELLVSDGRVIAGTSEGLWVIELGKPLDPDQPLLPGATITSLLREPDGVLVASGQTVQHLRWSATGFDLKPLSLPITNYIDGLARDRQGTLWVATLAGVVEAPPDAAARLLLPRRALPASLPDPKLTDALVDRAGGVWLSTSGAGVAYLRPDWREFEFFEHDPLDATTLPAERMQAVAACPDGRQYAIGLGGELVEIADTVIRLARVPATAVTALHCDPGNRLWVGSDAGLQQLDAGFVVARRFTTVEGLPSSAVSMIIDGENGELWLATTRGGIARLHPDGKVQAFTQREHGIVVPSFEQLQRAPDGRIWLADGSGLRVFDSACACFRAIEGLQHRVDTFVFVDATTLYAYSAGQLLGLRVAGKNAVTVFDTLGAAQGLPPTNGSSLLAMAPGQLWLSGARGLFDIDLTKRRARVLGAHLGSALHPGLRPSAVFRNGSFLDATLGGVVRAHPGAQMPSSPPPNLRWLSASLQRGNGGPVNLVPGIPWTLRHDDRNLRVEVRLLSHADSAAHHHQFWLEGSEPGFGDAVPSPAREFTLLPPGDYRLHVRATDGLGRPAAQILIQPIVVLPPWWQTPWAYVLYVFLLVAVVLAGFAIYRRRLKTRHALQISALQAEMAARASQAKSEFLADIGHEIRTPMSGVLGMADLLLGEPLPPTPRRWAETIKRSGQHMLGLINDLLDLSRIEAGQLILEPTSLRLAEVLHEVAAMESSLLAARSQKLSIDCPPDLILRVDGKRLRQVLINLLGNACKFTPVNGLIRIHASIDAPSVQIQVIDQGPGMTAAEIGSLFARFAQTDLGRSQGGSGLGLVICRRLLTAMNGQIGIDSHPGQGTCFTVTLPVGDPANSELQSGPSLATNGSTLPLSGERILLVEDQIDIGEAMAGLLGRLGAEVVCVPNALSALAELSAAPFNRVLSDLDLPGLDGFALASLARSRHPGMDLVAISARSEADTEARALTAGYSVFLRKPVTFEMLRDWAVPR
ncbi:MAG: response regulator [Ahniella sp.]|nr:response regulator [Ahniella sp.]